MIQAWCKRYGLFGLIRLSYDTILTKLFYFPARLVRRPVYIRGRSGMTWGSGFTTGVGLRMDAETDKKCLIIGKNVQLNDYVHIGAINEVIIGNDVLVASKVYISDHNHGGFNEINPLFSPDIIPTKRPLTSKAVRIGNKVWIGEGVCILPGVTIGDGAVIGAGSIVTRDIPENSLAVGSPAKVIKRFDITTNSWRLV